MTWTWYMYLWPLVLGLSQAPPMSDGQSDPCADFYRALDAVPHVSLIRRTGPIESTWPGEPSPLCEVSFQTTDSALAGVTVPLFDPAPGSDLYREGWRFIPEILADGAGSGIHGIQRGTVRCVVRWEQAAYIDDDGTFVQSDTLRLLVQCGDSG